MMIFLPLIFKIFILSLVFICFFAISYYFCERHLIKKRGEERKGYLFIVIIFIIISLFSGYLALYDKDIEFLGYSFFFINIMYFFKALKRIKY